MPPKRRNELPDEPWDLIRILMPKAGLGGRRNDHRTILDSMLWVLRCGSAWRNMPERYGSWTTVYSRFRRWTDNGTLDRSSHACEPASTATG
jgi:transposase